MSTKRVSLDYLSNSEIELFYELFFGKILIKRPNFSYHSNLTASLKKESFITTILSKLKPEELEILKLLSTNLNLTYPYMTDKLSIILDMQQSVVNKAVSNMLTKNYLFLRDDSQMIVPDIYFEPIDISVEINRDESKIDGEPYSSKLLTDINNLINFFISRELKFSNSRSLYKKDLSITEDTFKKYSKLNSNEINAIASFFATAFTDEEGNLIINELKQYFNLTPLEQILYFTRLVFPAFYTILQHCYSYEQTTSLSSDDFHTLWVQSFLKTQYNFIPTRMNFNESLELFTKAGLITVTKTRITLPWYSREEHVYSNQLKVSSNFTLYLNVDAIIHDFYLPALFADLIKYNKLVEYEITESSIQRGIHHGLKYEQITEFIGRFNLQLSSNVQTTLQQWFDKYGSFYYVTGTLFICRTQEKGKLIKTLIKEGVVKGIEVKPDELFLIQETDTEAFFHFLKKSDIYYFKKEPVSPFSQAEELQIPDLNDLLDYVEQ